MGVLTQLRAHQGDWPAQRAIILTYPLAQRASVRSAGDGDWDPVPDSWDDVRRAMNAGLITFAQFQEAQRARQQMTAAAHPWDEFYSEDQPRTPDGRFGEGDGALTRDTPLGASLLNYATDMTMSADARHSAEAGTPNTDAQRILTEVERSTIDEPVHRGIAIEGGLDAIEQQFAIGTNVDVPMGSFTADRSISEKFAQWSRDAIEGEKTEVFFTVPAGAHGMQVPYNALQLDEYFSQEKETIISGDFRVKEITRGSVSDYYDPGQDERIVLNVVLEAR